MAYENPYANTMNYKPRSLWNQPERPRTDWSTFWGKADEDEDEKDKDDGRGDETRVEAGAGSELKSLWGDVWADMQEGYKLGQSENMFDNLFGPGITAVTPATTVPNDQQYVSGWKNPDYTGPFGNTQPELNLDFITDVSLPSNTGGNTQAQTVTQGLPSSNVQPSEVIQEYQPSYSQPSYEQQQQDLIDQSTQAYNQQQNSLANVPMDTDFISNIPDWRDMVGQGGLTQRQSAQSFANAPTVAYGNTGATNPTLGEVLNGYTDPETGAEIDFDAVTDEERDWGDFW